jgi:hypothetical protein
MASDPMTQDTEKLAACPCCRAEAHLIPHAFGLTQRFYIQCEHCGLRTPHHKTEAEAIAAWSQRTPPTDTPDGELAREVVAGLIGDAIYGPTRRNTYRHVTLPCADRILSRLTPPVVAQPTATFAPDSPKPDTYRGWQVSFDYGYFNATHPDFEADWQGEEDGWVGSHPTLSGRTRADMEAEVDAWFEDNQPTAEQVREAAAKVAEEHYRDHSPCTVRAVNYRHAGHRIAAAIRAMPLPKASDKTTPVADDGLRGLLRDWWEESRRYIYDKTPERREKQIDRFKPRIDAALSALQHKGGSGDAVREALERADRALHDEGFTVVHPAVVALAAALAALQHEGGSGDAVREALDAALVEIQVLQKAIAISSMSAEDHELFNGPLSARDDTVQPWTSGIYFEANSKSDASPTGDA